DESHAVGPPNTHARHMEALDPQVSQQRELIVRIHLPTVCGANGGARVPGIPLVHGNDAIVWRELCDGIPGRFVPKRHCRATPTWRDQQERKSLAMFFLVQLHISTGEYRHGSVPSYMRGVFSGSAMTRFSISPSFAMAIFTTSPAFSHLGGFIAAATPPGVPVEITSPGSRVNAVDKCATKSKQLTRS